MNEAATSVFASSAEPAVPPALTTPDLPEGPNWTVLVTKIQAGDPAGLEQLYKMFSRGLRYFLGRQFGCQDLDDKLHDVFLAVLKAIQEGSLREPERLPGFIRTIAQRTAARHIEIRVQKRTRESEMPNTMEFADVKENPEKQAISKERAEVAKTALAQLNAHDREILLRYYVHEESQEQICAEMNLTETQFRLHKSRAKARFGEIGKKRLQKPIYRRAASA